MWGKYWKKVIKNLISNIYIYIYIYIYIKGDHESIKTNSQMILTSEIFLLVNLALKYALQVSFLD